MSREFLNLVRDFESIFGKEVFPEYNMRVKEKTDNQRKTLIYNSSVPSVNLFEDSNLYRYELITPGLSKDDINIELIDGTLCFSGERKVESSVVGSYVSKEYHHTKFRRDIVLPLDSNEDDIYAKSENGVTKIFVPKKVNKEKQRKKVVKVG